jgi:carbon-monoxide dehydrogenase small subunit
MAFTSLQKTHLHLSVNNEDMQVLVDTSKTLLEVLREDMALTGTKHGCELGECGACTVLIDGKPVMSCLVLALECEGVRIETIEGMAGEGQLHPLQQAFAEHGGSQCGYCTPGILMTAKALLTKAQDRESHTTQEEIREALSGNLCRCTGYQQIIESVEAAAVAINESGSKPAGTDS